jgi:hypothetical protein
MCEIYKIGDNNMATVRYIVSFFTFTTTRNIVTRSKKFYIVESYMGT